MPAQITSLNKIPFTQSKFINFLQTDDSKFFQKKILKISNSKEPFAGFCYGAAVKFLHYSDKGLEHDYINTYNRYLDNIEANNTMIQKNRSDLAMTFVADYKNHVEKKHIIKQGNKLLKGIFNIQKLRYKSVSSKKLSLPIPSSSPIFEEKNLFKLISLALNENLEKHIDKNNRLERIVSLPMNEENIKLAKKIHILNENNKVTEKHHPAESATDTESNQKKINEQLNSMDVLKKDKIKKEWRDVNEQQNLIACIKNPNDYKMVKKFDNFTDFIRNNKNENNNFIFLSQNHACAINVKKKYK